MVIFIDSSKIDSNFYQKIKYPEPKREIVDDVIGMLMEEYKIGGR